MYTLFLAFRYLRSRVVIWFALGGVIVCVASLVVIMSVMEGFGEKQRRLMRGATADILVSDPNGAGMTDYDPLAARIVAEVPEVEACSPYIERPVMLTPRVWSKPKGQWKGQWKAHTEREEAALLRGIDPVREPTIQHPEIHKGYLHESLLARLAAYDRPPKDNPETPAVAPKRGPPVAPAILGDSLMRYHTMPDQIIITGPIHGSMSRPINYLAFEPIGRFRTDNPEYDSMTLCVSLKAAQALLLMDDTVTGLQVKVRSGADPKVAQQAIVAVVRAGGHDWSVERWEERSREMLDALALEKALSGLILFLAIIVAAFGLTTILDMTVSNKKYDIGVLGAIGANRWAIARIFLAAGLLLGIVGASVGLGLGILLVTNLNGILKIGETLFGLRLFDPAIYAFEAIPTQWDPWTYLIIVLASVAVCTVASLLPALHAGRLRPVDCLSAGR